MVEKKHARVVWLFLPNGRVALYQCQSELASRYILVFAKSMKLFLSRGQICKTLVAANCRPSLTPEEEHHRCTSSECAPFFSKKAAIWPVYAR